MAVTKAQLAHSSWELLYDSVNTSITDPKSRGIQWIFAAFPDTKKWPEGKDAFPILVLDSPDVINEKIVFSDSKRNFIFRTYLSIFATRMDEVDSLADSFYQLLDSNYSYLAQNKLFVSIVRGSTISSSIYGNERVHEKKIALEFQSVL